MFYEIRQKAFDTELGKVQGKVGKATLDYSKYINSERGSTWYAYDTKYLQDEVSRGRSAQQIYRTMIEGVYGKSRQGHEPRGHSLRRVGQRIRRRAQDRRRQHPPSAHQDRVRPDGA